MTTVAYDKTIEAGVKAKEHVQEYVQEQVQNVGEKLQTLKKMFFQKCYFKTKLRKTLRNNY